jgi:hypothetical protein
MATILDKKIKRVDNTSPMGGGTFLLQELTIMSPSTPSVVHLNSPGFFEELNIYEDLFSNVLRGTFTFIDNQGLAEKLPIIGDETIILSFTTPGAGSKQETVPDDLESGAASEEIFEQMFRVYDCIETTTGESSKIYKLFFVSPEYIASTKTKISKGYKGRFYHQIVKDALNKVNKHIDLPWRKKTYIEKTGTPQNVIVPNWTPFQAINFCASRSLSSNIEDTEIENPEKNQKSFAPGSLFVFYEKLGTGFFYESIETMIVKQSTKKQIPLYQYTPKTAGDASKNVGLSFFGVEQFDIKGSFKTLENLGYGMYGSKLIAYDPIRMKFDEVKYDYYEKEENPTRGVNAKTFKDNEAKPNQIENWLLQREMQVQEFGNIIITFNVAGNSARHVGDMIRFEIPTSIPPDDMGTVSVGHQLYSGYYIVSKIRHIITPSEYKTDLELIKNSFAKRIPGQKNLKGGKDAAMNEEAWPE